MDDTKAQSIKVLQMKQQKLFIRNDLLSIYTTDRAPPGWWWF